MKYIFSAFIALLTSAFAYGADITPRDTYPAKIQKAKEAIGKVSEISSPAKVISRADAKWVDYGVCDYTDDILTSFFSVEPVSYKVKVQKDEANEGFYKIVDPWTDYPDRDKIFAENADAVLPSGENIYILIDASDPNYVRILNSPIGVDDGYGVSSLCTRTELVGEPVDFYPLTQEEADLCAGKLVDGVISFEKNRSFAVIQDGSYYPANGDAAFRLDLNLSSGELVHSWVDYGVCDYTDDILTSFFSVEPVSYKVKVQKDEANEGFYKIVDPWTDYPDRDKIFAENADAVLPSGENIYILIDASDPNYVRILNSPIGVDDGYGVSSLCTRTELVGEPVDFYPLTQEEADLCAGKLVDGVITFEKARSFAVIQDGSYYPANGSAAFRLDLNLNKQELSHNWVDLAICDYIDDIATGYFTVEPVRFKVQVQKDQDNEGFYRIVNIWNNYPYRDNLKTEYGFDVFSDDSYIILDATNPDYVRVLDSPVGMDDGDGATTIRSLTELVGVQLGDNPVTQAQADLAAGKLADNVIKFIANPALILQQNGTYYPANRNGAFALALPGGKLPVDYSFTLTMKESFCPDSDGNFHITVNGDDEIEGVCYAVMGTLPEKVEDSFIGVATACDLNKEIAINVNSYDAATLYAVFATYNADNKVKASTYITLSNPDAKKSQWAYLGKADMTEGFLSCSFPTLFDVETYEVDVECLNGNKSILRVVNPYGDSWSYAGTYAVVDNHDHYIYINAENPDNVYVEYSPIGVSIPGYGECAISSDYVNLIAAYGLSFLEMFDIYSGGYLKDNVLTFDRTCDIKLLPKGYGAWIYTNIFKNPDYDPETDKGDYDDRIAGNFKLDFTKAFSGIENIVFEESTDGDAEYYNLQGIKIDSPSKGIVVRRQGGKAIKEIIR